MIYKDYGYWTNQKYSKDVSNIVKKIRNIIKGTIFEGSVFIAGGFIRDWVMNRSSDDIDIVVSSQNGGVELAKFLSEKFNVREPVIYETFGTAMINVDDFEIEFVATRKETYNFEDRKPEVDFGSIKDDVMRRDFTINSLLYDISNDKIIDFVDGGKDISNKIIRTTGDPEIIFAEDPLRIMRAIRFATTLGFTIEDKTWNEIKNFVPWLKNISNERIRDEFVKIITSDNVHIGIHLLSESGILEYMLPVFTEVKKIKNQGKHHTKDLMGHTVEVMMNIQPTVEHRLSALLHDVGKPATMRKNESGDITFYGHQVVSKRIAGRFMRRFKFTNEQIKMVETSVVTHMNFCEGFTTRGIRRLVSKMGKEMLLFCMDLVEADSKSKERVKIVDEIRELIESDVFIIENKMENVPVSGYDVMEILNIKPSKRVGEVLNIVREWIIDDPNLTREEVIEKIKKEVKNENTF